MSRRTTCSAIFAALLFEAAIAPIASATETITYTYDARGRVIKVERSGSTNNGVASNYTYDKANNRTNVTVTGSPH